MWFCFGLNPTGSSYFFFLSVFSYKLFSLFLSRETILMWKYQWVVSNILVLCVNFLKIRCSEKKNYVFRKTLQLVRLSLPQRSGINSHCRINCQSPVIWFGLNKLDWCLFDHLLASGFPGLHVAECWCPGRNRHTGEVGWGSGVCLGGYDRKSKCHLWSLRPSCSTDSV